MNIGHVLLILTTALAANGNDSEEKCFADGCGGKVVALVPARSGSKGIKRKNLSRIGNDTLIGRALKAIRKSGQFDSIWVSTDDREIAEESRSNDARVHWRDPLTATDNATTLSAIKDFLQSHEDADILAVVQCTSPFLKPEFLSSAFLKMKNESLDCIFSATRVFSLLWTDNNGGFVRPLNFDPGNRPRRQDWAGELVENGMFYFFKKELATVEGVIQNNRCKVFEIAKEYSFEIDTPRDLTIARKISELIDNETGIQS